MRVLVWLRGVVTSSGCEGQVLFTVAEEPVAHGGCYEEFLAGFDPDYSPPKLRHESHTYDWDQTADLWQVPHCRVLLSLRRPGTHRTLTPACLSPRLRGPNKDSGFSFHFVCLRVGPS